MAVPIEIDVWQGDIAELEVDAILLPANESLFMTTPVAQSVKRRAGDVVERDAVRQGPAMAGSAIVTGGGSLAAPYVVHCVAVGHDLRADVDRLHGALNAALDAAAHLGLRRIATALIGTERGAFPADDAAGHLASVLEQRAASGAWLPATLVAASTVPAEVAAFRNALQPIGSPG